MLGYFSSDAPFSSCCIIARENRARSSLRSSFRVFVGLIIGAPTGFDFSNVTLPLMMKIIQRISSVAAHAVGNALVTRARNARYRTVAQELIQQALKPGQQNAADLLNLLNAERPSPIEDVFAPRKGSAQRIRESERIRQRDLLRHSQRRIEKRNQQIRFKRNATNGSYGTIGAARRATANR